MRHGRLALALLFGSFLAWSAAQSDDEPSADEARDKAVAERFRKVLETNPRRGTALDKLYGYHVERGTLDKLVAEYADRAKKDAKDGIAWMIVGLLESQRGRDAAAVAAFRQAETTLPQNAMPAYYLGQSLVLLGQPDAAAAAFERAITRKPNRTDLLDAFQALGRVYQRSQRTEQALGVWSRLEKLYPDDARVQEQIATTLVEEGQFDQALPRLVKLADATDDKYRQTTLRMDAADLKVKLKRTPEALADFEKLTADLNPDSWLYRDVRRRIEDVFLRNDDLAGLAKYYESWLAKHPADVDAVARLAKNLASQGRAPEARDWLQKGLAAAPTHRSLRQALIDQFVFEQNFAAAAKEYEALEKADPNNPDTLREWGRLLMRDVAKPEAERRAAATAVWRRLLEKKPNDPVVASQVADLMRTAGASDDAIALYKKAIELAPNAPQYREYLGEYYHSLKRSTEALATWRPMAEGANRTSKNLARLAEVFAGFGYRPEAITAMADAISLEKDDFMLLMTYAELLHQEGRHDDALKQIALAGKLTSNPEEAEQILAAEIKIYQASDTLGDRIDELQKELDKASGDASAPRDSAERWLRLARLYEANRQADKATETIGKATAKDPKSVPAMIAAARIYEGGGDILAAADANRKLAALDRRYRSEYLTTVAKLEQRLGRREHALQAGRDLLAASPGNPEVYKFFADLCFQLGDAEEGLEALRRSVRANPSDPAGLLTLAGALSERVRQGEAIELLWRAFEKTNELEAKLGIIDRIAQLYLENNQFDRLLERLERERREAEKTREMTLCVAQAYTTAGDLGTARAQLERLLTENTRDTHLLGQLGTLCETEGDIAAAVKYQRQLNAAAPNNYDHQLRLAQLLTRVGEADEAADIWVKLVANETEPHRNLSAIDSLMTAGKHDSAVAVLSRLLARKPGDWELLYREGTALTAKGKRDEAAARFNAVLAMKLPDDEMGEIAKNQMKQAKKKATAAPKPGQPQTPSNPYVASRYEEWNNPPLTRRTQNTHQLRNAIGMESRYYYGGNVPPFYSPSDYGEARMACLGWLYEAARAKDEHDAYVKQLKTAKDKSGADPRTLWDWYYFQTLRQETKDVLPTALALSKGSDPAGQLAFLNALGTSRATPGSRVVRRGAGDPKDNTPPLPADQLAHAVECYRKLRQAKPEWAGAVANGLMTELKRAKREGDEQALYRDLMKDANTVTKVQSALTVAAGRKDIDACTELFARLEKLQPSPKTSSALGQLPTRQTYSTFQTLNGKLAEDKRLPDTRKILDLYLSTARRQNLTTPRSASSNRRASTTGTSVQLYNAAGYYRQAQVTFPSANEYYDTGSISLLYNAFDQHKKADLQSDLFAHVRKQLDAAQGAERLYAQLALGYLHWWADEKDEALARLGDAIAAAPGDHNLAIEVAALREQTNDFDAALTLLDSVTPLDTQMMQRREEAALRVAERTGNLDRARQAADRLFGLRLDADKQLELAGKMHRLGMHAMAETVLGRAQRQAGNKTATLLRLMNQYQSQNQGELAVSIARQILRKGPSVNTNPRRGGDETDTVRTQAIGVLARSGQLKDMIERAEAQLKASPKSVQIHQALVGYYQAAGDKAKVKATLLKMADLKPDDGKLRYQLAEQLQQAGERAAALDQYAIAIKLEPSVFASNYYQIPNWFSQANRLDELGKILDEIDLRKLGSYHYTSEPIAALLREAKTKDIGLKLFKKAWEAFPQQRGYLLGRLYDEDIWRLPEMYGYAKQAVIPREDSEIDPWQSAAEIMSYQGDGRVDGVISRMMSVARKQQRLPELRDEVSAALAKRPDWVGGKAILGVIEIQAGNKEKGKALWKEAFDLANPGREAGGAGAVAATPGLTAGVRPDVPAMARFILAQELEFYAGVEDMALATLEGGIDELIKEGNTQFSYGPGRRLVWWYRQMGRQDDAKKLLRKFADPDKSSDVYGGNPGYYQYRLAEDGVAIAQEFMAMNEPVEAIRVYNRLLSDKDLFEQAAQWGGGRQYEQQAEQGMQAAYKALKPATLPAAVGSLLTPRPTAPILDLVVLIDSRDLTKSSLGSVLATALKSTEKTPEVRRDALAKLADLSAKHPADFSVQTAAALAAFADGKADDIQKAVDRLVKLAESTPLEPLPPSGKANARHRAEALPQVALWLVARECLAKDRESLWPAGDKLAARASAAGKRQQDVQSAAAILREWGQIELDRGNKAKAEALWTELLELAVPKPAPKKVAFAPSPAAAVALMTTLQVPPTAVSFTATTQVAPAGAARGGTPALTNEQFLRVYEIATLAADKGLSELSLQAMREVLRGGPPLPAPPSRGGGGYTSRTINGVQYLFEYGYKASTGVDEALLALVPKWRAAKVPANELYALLAEAVLPTARPAEVFLHNEPKSRGQVYMMSSGGGWTPTTDPGGDEADDRGLGGLLARVAVEAGKADDLRTRLEARSNQPLGELPARLMLATLAVETKDEARALKAFEALTERVKKDSTVGTNDRVAVVLTPVLADAKYAAAVAPALQKVAENFAAGSATQKAADLRFKLAEYHLRRKDEAAARAQYKAVADFGKAVGRGAYDPHLPLAREFLKAGWAEEALTALGVHTDAKSAADADPQKRARRGDPSLEEFPRLVRALLAMSADKRYAALKAWTLPTADRKSIRYYVGPTPKLLPPPEFVKLPPIPADAIVSTMTLLTDAAKAVGKLDELSAEADKLVADTIDSAELLKAMVVLAQGQAKAGEPVVKAFAESVRKRLTAEYERPAGQRYDYDEDGNYDSGQTAFRPSEYLFAALCLTDPAFAAHGESLLATLAGKARGNVGYIDRIEVAQDRLKAARAGATDALAGGQPPRWHAATPRSRWFAQDGYLSQPTNDQTSFLLTDVPLTGTFEFSVDAWRAPYSDSHAGYGGVVFAPGMSSYDSMVWAVGKTDYMKHMADGARYSQFNRITVQVSPGKVRCLVNGKLYFEDADTPPTAPWPMLVAELGSRPVFRNFTMAGTPEVPAEVKLSAGDFLDGWQMHLSEGKLPRRLAAKERAAGKPANQQAWAVEEEPKAEKEPVYDWRAKAGELLGRKLERPSDKPVPSNLAYFRSMRPGETIRYEFFHEPGATHVHPSLGRLAFLIEPEGVKLHWMTDATADAWTGLAADNVIDAAEGRRGNVALKGGDWNTVALTTTDDGVKLELNGTAVYESKLAADNERTFGLFHYRDRTAARVRNVVLTGAWPKAVGEIAFATKPTSAAVAKARRSQLGERYYASEAGDIVAKAAKLPPAERYKALADWVLPTESRPAFQLSGDVKPLDVLGVVDRKLDPGSQTPATGRRVMLGGRFEVPCLDMVAAAKECGALDELAGRISKAGPAADDDLFRRSQAALSAVVLAAQGKDAEATDALRKLAGFAGAMKPDAPGAERWPDLIAALGTLDRPALMATATELARLCNRNLNDGVVQKKSFDDRGWWERAFRAVLTSAEMAALPAADRRPGADGFAHWASVAALSAEGRGQGWGRPAWAVRNGQPVHFPGHDQDYLVLRTPLRGDFEVTCRLKVQDWNEARVRYGAYQFDLEHDWKKYKLHTSIRNEQQASTIAPPLPASKDNWFAFRLAVKDGWFRAFVDGREIASERIGANPDPWLMLHAVHSYTAEVRDLKIAGNPTVPDKIDLLAGDRLGMWRPYLGSVKALDQRYYGDGYGNGWQMRGEEVYNQGKTPEPPDEGKPVSPRSFPESALFYQRPFAEDGAVEYEFFYDPGKAHVHPTLDRLTFLLEPDGVRLHWLTDGASDKSGVPFDNATDEPSCRRGPAKLPLTAKAWNKVRLAVAGYTVTLALNGEPVYERTIEATNQRLFGLFHYTDRTEARVRSVTLTGDWPRTLPPMDRLFDAKSKN